MISREPVCEAGGSDASPRSSSFAIVSLPTFARSRPGSCSRSSVARRFRPAGTIAQWCEQFLGIVPAGIPQVVAQRGEILATQRPQHDLHLSPG
jgi:hypothetical protein